MIEGAGGKAVGLAGDAGNWSDVQRVVDDALGALGGIDILFNNAGVNIRGLVHELAESDWDAVFTTTLKSTGPGSPGRMIFAKFLSAGSASTHSSCRAGLRRTRLASRPAGSEAPRSDAGCERRDRAHGSISKPLYAALTSTGWSRRMISS